MEWTTHRLAVASLGLALIVFFAGSTAAVAAGANAPDALWAAGGAVSGGLLGLLAPSPARKSVRDVAMQAAAAATAQDRVNAATSVMSWATFVTLLVVFGLLLALAIVLAGGAIRPPASFGATSIHNITKAVIALASAAGSGVLGLLVPKAPSG